MAPFLYISLGKIWPIVFGRNVDDLQNLALHNQHAYKVKVFYLFLYYPELKIIGPGGCADITVKTFVRAVTKIVLIGGNSYCARNGDDLSQLIKAGCYFLLDNKLQAIVQL